MPRKEQHMSTAYKKMTSHGSICIPVAMRRDLGLEGKDPMVVEEEGGRIIIRPYEEKCIFCKSTENIKKLYGRGICLACAKRAYEMLKEEA